MLCSTWLYVQTHHDGMYEQSGAVWGGGGGVGCSIVRSLTRSLARSLRSGGTWGGGWRMDQSNVCSLAAVWWYMGWWGEDESLNCPLARSLARSCTSERWYMGWCMGGWVTQLCARSLAHSLTHFKAVVYGVVGGGWISQMSARSLQCGGIWGCGCGGGSRNCPLAHSLTCSERWYMEWWVEHEALNCPLACVLLKMEGFFFGHVCLPDLFSVHFFFCWRYYRPIFCGDAPQSGSKSRFHPFLSVYGCYARNCCHTAVLRAENCCLYKRFQ